MTSSSRLLLLRFRRLSHRLAGERKSHSSHFDHLGREGYVFKNLITNAILFLGSLLIAVVVGEIALRMMRGAPLQRVEPQVRYDPHAIRTFTLRPSQSAFSLAAPVHVDGRGFRVTSAGDTAASGVRIFALGDSFTFGLGVGDQESWPAVLEQRLNLCGPRAMVTNGGTISYGVFQEMDLLRESAPDIHPEVVIHGLYWNDYQSAHAPEPGSPSVLRPNGLFVWEPDEETGFSARSATRFAVAHSTLASTLSNFLRRHGEDSGDETSYGGAYRKLIRDELAPESWRPVAEFYDRLVTLSNSLGFQTFVVIMPVIDIVRLPDAPMHSYPRQMRKILEERQIPYLDGFAVVQRTPAGRDLFLSEGPDAHLNAAGHRVIAEALERALLADSDVGSRLGGQESFSCGAE